MPLKVSASSKGVRGSGSLKPEVRQLKRHLKNEIKKVKLHARATAKAEVQKMKSAVMNDKNIKRVVKRTKKINQALK